MSAQSPCNCRDASGLFPNSLRATSAQQPGNFPAASGKFHRIATLVSASSPCPHPVRDRARSLSVAAHSPLPRRVRKYGRVQSMTAHIPYPWSVRVQSTTAHSLRSCFILWKIQICPLRFPLSVRAVPCGRLSPLNPLRQPTARAATDSVHLAFRAAGRCARRRRLCVRPDRRPIQPHRTPFIFSWRSRAGVVLKNKIQIKRRHARLSLASPFGRLALCRDLPAKNLRQTARPWASRRPFGPPLKSSRATWTRANISTSSSA